MPYEVTDQHPDCSGFAVVKQGTMDMVSGACHMSKAAAMKQVAALYAEEGGMMEHSARAEMTAKSINDLLDSAFAYIEPGGSKDDQGKTVPRSKRHFPIHDAAHVRNALARAPQSPFGAKAMPKIRAAAKKMGIGMSEENSQPPSDNLIRSRLGDDAAVLRDSDVDGRTLFGHFAVFNRWTEIDSLREGHFIERIAPGAFARTFSERGDRIKVLYDHGKDPQLGNKPLGRLVELREDDEGGYYEVELIDTPYNDEFVIPAARAGLLGASFRFSVAANGEKWNRRPARSDFNPNGLPERTIGDADVFELGPVTWPAYEGATAGVRSGTDDFLDHLMHDPRFVARFIDRAGLTVVERLLESLPPTAQDDQPPTAPVTQRETPDDSADGQPSPPDTSLAARRQLARRIRAERLGVGKEIR